MNKQKKIIIITAIAVIIVIVGVIVGCSVSKHNTAVKEALSVSESKQNLYDSLLDNFKEVTDNEYSSAEDYESAINDLNNIKENISKSDISEDERMIALAEDIDKTIVEYENKIKDLTTTTTTEATTEAETEKVTESSTAKAVNATTAKSNSSSNNTTKKSNNSNNTTKATTKAQTTTKPTTTAPKSYDPAPAYGTVQFTYPTGNYKEDHWSCGHVYWTWNGSSWDAMITISGGMHTPCNKDDFVNRCVAAFPEPSRNGKYNGEEVDKAVYIWN